MPLVFGAQGVTPSLRGMPSQMYSLQAGEVMLIPPGMWAVKVGRYTTIQEYDPVTTIWRTIGDDGNGIREIQSDGVNFRVANQTGCAVGALITNGGSGYTSAPAVAASGGSSKWTAIVGGAINTSVTVANGGTGYTYPPHVQISAPPTPGIQATAYATISSGAVSSVTVVDQGAGYTQAPTVTFVNDPRDTTGVNAVATTALTGSGTITGLVCIDHGNAVTSLPTLSFTGGGGSNAAATTIMCWSITAYTVTSAGSGYFSPTEVSALDNFPTTSPAYTNVSTQKNLVRHRKASITAGIASSGVTTAGAVITDGGIYTATALPFINFGLATPASYANLGVTMGGQSDVIMLIAA